MEDKRLAVLEAVIDGCSEVLQPTSTIMDECDRKFAEMQKYLPFLEAMIERLKKAKDRSREPQLQKMQSLHGILSSNTKKLKIDVLQRCEEVIQKLHNKVGKGITAGSNPQNSKKVEDTKPLITGNLETQGGRNSVSPDRGKDSKMRSKGKQHQHQQQVKKEETPASPSPPASPDQTSESKTAVKPIIIPTERSDGFTGSIADDRPASPDVCEMIVTRAPIIIPTERADEKPMINPLTKTDPDPAPRVSRWGYVNSANTKHSAKPIPNLWQSEQSQRLIKTVEGNSPNKTPGDARPRVLRHIPTVPTPSAGGGLLRRPILVLDKSRSESESPASKLDSPKSSTPETRIRSPESENRIHKTIITSPKSKELPPLPKLPATPLLVSPPPVLTVPPLTIEDLAELLNDEDDDKSNKKKDSSIGKDTQKKVQSERLVNDEIRKADGEIESKIPSIVTTGTCSKDGKITKNYVTQEDVDRDNDKRWEEVDRHIIKMTSRRGFSSPSGTPTKSTDKSLSVSQISHQTSPNVSLINTDRPTDPRNRPPSPPLKDREPPPEPRYADNYEKHPRHSRDSLKHNNTIPDLNLINSAFPRASDNDATISIQSKNHAQTDNNQQKSDDRTASHFHRRSYSGASVHSEPVDPRRENSEFYRNHVAQQQQQQNANRAQLHHSPGRSVEASNPGQWTANPHYTPVAQGTNMYQPRPDMWTMKSVPNNMPMEPHMINDPGHIRPQQFPNMLPNPCSRPMMSPQDMNLGSCMDSNYCEEIPSVQMPQMAILPQHPTPMPVMLQPPGLGPQYRAFPPDNRTNAQQFDRPQEFPHNRQSWDPSVNRPAENNSYPRPAGPGQWNRGNRATGGPPTGSPSTTAASVPPAGNRDRNFNDDRRRTDATSRSAGFGRGISERDPRMRQETSAPSQNANSPSSGATGRRDPRIGKETPQSTTGKSSKDASSSGDRDPRRKSFDSKDSKKNTSLIRKSHEKKRSRKKSDTSRRDSEVESKSLNEKSSKDVMQSPLESLYGVIDTTAKTGKGYGLQKFKIPKIKRPEPVPSPPKSSPIVSQTEDENWDLPDESTTQFDSWRANDALDQVSSAEVCQISINNDPMDDKKGQTEVTSSTGETCDEPLIIKDTAAEIFDNLVQKNTGTVRSTERTDKLAERTADSDQAVDTSTRNTEDNQSITKDTEAPKFKDEVTQEWIEALIRKSLESGEGKKLLEQAKLLQKWGEARAKKFKKIQKIIDSESESSSDKEEEPVETKKAANKKKRRVIMSDSSDEECLAERLGLMASPEKEKSDKTAKSRVEEKDKDENVAPTTIQDKETLPPVASVTETNDISEDSLLETSDSLNKKGKPFRRKSRKKKNTSVPTVESTKEQSIDEQEVVAEAIESVQEKEAVPADSRPAKVKLKRRNSLEMLQEDIREMFISEGVVTATGHRMCRLIKEAQSHLNSSVESLSSSKKKGSTSSLDRQGAKTESEAEETTSGARRSNSRVSGVRTRSRRKTRSRGKVRKSAKEIATSDSETEDSARTEINRLNDTVEGNKGSDDSVKSDATVEAIKLSKDDSEGKHFLRRSERVGLRESMKEPKTVEKSEAGKIDSSKIMFDSSSDESFGIDVSELAAAVDISLHPEPQPQISSSPVGKSTSTKSPVLRKRQSTRRKGHISKIIEDKVDNAASGDDVESIASDISRASSIAAGKKVNAPTNKPDTNEELLSDILIGLVSQKNSGEKSASDISKSIDGDAENEFDELRPPTVELLKKIPRKKKKPSWQLGILAKRKKKKVQSPISTGPPEPESETTNRIKESESALKPSNEKTPDDTTIAVTNVKSLADDSASEIDLKVEILSNTVSSQPQDSTIVDNSAENETIVPKKEVLSPIKDKTRAENSSLQDSIDSKSLIELFSQPTTLKSDTETEPRCEEEPNFGLKRLINYVWSAKKDRFRCLYCPFVGKNIVHHYTLGHPEKEMMISRLHTSEAKRAIAQTPTDNKTNSKSASKTIRKFTCRFCIYTIEGSLPTTLEAFYEHCTTHTGEYRFRCNGCPYQTVAKSSMRTHYYRRVCSNKHHGTISCAISEDPVPNDVVLYGYICTKCHFVQLKEKNVERHVKSLHDNSADAEIQKINMSSFMEKDFFVKKKSSGNIETRKECGELKNELESAVDNETVDSNVSATEMTEETDNIDIDEGTVKNEDDSQSLEPKKPTDEDLQPETAVVSSESGAVAGNLSAFVCPPELENKEDEIQLERRKKMQEVVENIGILNKVNEKRDLSIIDKLKDKMTTNLEESLKSKDALPDINIPLAPENSSVTEDSSVSTGNSIETTKTEVKNAVVEETKTKDSANNSCIGEKVQEIKETTVKSEPMDPSVEQIQQQSPKHEIEAESEDKSDKKIQDPLANLDEQQKNDTTDGDDSDNDTVVDQPQSYTPAVAYESDTTTDQSDTEISTDVRSLLEETYSISTAANAPMVTTIQRLAAQLKGGNSAASLATSSNEGGIEGDIENFEEQTSEKEIPKPPNAIPIASIRRFLGRRDAMLQEVAKEVAQEVTKDNRKEVTETPPVSPPKKFIRLRRLSGDKLSVPNPEISAPAQTVQDASSIEASVASRVSENDGTTPMDGAADGGESKTEDECSFLRIENVVSLAPGIVDHANEPIVSNIRKAVANSPLKSASTISVLKKSSPNILKRPLNRTAAVSGVSLPVIQTVAPQIASIPKQNFKIVKVVRGLTLLKHKDSTHRIFGNKLKNPDTFAAMLQPVKLRHFYKCMARNCTFTTDCPNSFGAHYRQHKDNVDRKILMTTYDFQRCAYCTETLTSWNAMAEHLKDKHVYCQYQCNYCFYRALAQSYVELHEMTVHPGMPASVLLGTRENPPIEVIDRREFVIPFVCQHECGKSFYVPAAFLAHLRTKHGNSLSIFKCHLCPAPSFKAEQLIAHYKLHMIFKYQCLYCLFGSEQAADVHAHLSASHYNRPPHILERSLQPCPVRDKDVIQQLIVLNVDDGYKCTELTLAPDQETDQIPTNKQWLQSDRNTTDGSASGQVSGSPTVNKLVEPVNSTNDPATPIVSKYKKIAPKRSAENILIVDETGAIKKIAKPKEPPAKNITDPLTEAIIATEEDPLSITGNLNCDESLGNFADSDNNVFTITRESQQQISLSTLVKEAITAESEIKNEDSDIEILEFIEKSSSTKKSKKNLNESASESLGKQDVSIKIESTATNTTENPPVIPSSSTENSLDLNLNSNDELMDNSFERPRTLEQIKDTGFSGSDLYKCGFDGCIYGAESAAMLRNHIKECIFATELNNLNCVHCSKRFVKIGFLLEHFKLHGLKRFGCSLCKDRWPMHCQAISHMRMKHKHSHYKLIPADPTNPSQEGLFIVQPVAANLERNRGKKRGRVKSVEKEGDKSMETEKVSFGPSDIETLPRQAIYQREVHCAVCPYTTKVRTNIIRHLQLHAKDETVPESGPVNPVPCLDKKERMFDKMVNLASSSHQNGRMGGKTQKDTTTENDADFLPKFVPEHKRYVCGVTECNYLSVDEAMLRSHIKALHPEEPYFRCPHCPAPIPGHEPQNIAFEKMGIHLKMHDTRLYKCSHCNHHHCHRHVVERHLSDKHAESRPYVKVIREIENTEITQQQTSQQEDGDEEPPDPDGNHWKCNICDYKCVYKSEMVAHVSSVHEEKAQFKCALCPYKSTHKINFDQHVNAKHSNDPAADYTMVFQKIKGTVTKKPAAEAVDSNNLDEPFDTTPLWRRDMPRVRHIRGILLEDEDLRVPESPAKTGKRKSEPDVSTKPVKSKVAKSSVSDSTEVESMWNNSTSSDTSSMTRKIDNLDDLVVDVETVSPTANILTNQQIVRRKIAPYGKPLGIFYTCTICQSFKTKYKHDMRDHLYRDLKYWRYRCKICGYMGVSKTSGLKHFMRTHENRRPTEDEQTPLPVDLDIETWVITLLKSQTAQMRGLSVDLDGNVIDGLPAKKAVPATESSLKTNVTNVTQSIAKDANRKSKTVIDPLRTTTDIDNTTNNSKLLSKATYTVENVVDDNLRGNDPLALDIKNDGLEDFADDGTIFFEEDETTVVPEQTFVCKHCNMQFTKLHPFKLHVEVRHLRRLKYLCSYCDVSSNCEKMMRRHSRLRHAERPVRFVPNPLTNPSQLLNQFWEKEYGVIFAESSKKRKKVGEESFVDQFDKTAGTHLCTKCGFRAVNIFGLKVHMRIHSTSSYQFKCAYCTFAAATKTDLWQHSELNHGSIDWKVGNDSAASIVEASENITTEPSDNVEEMKDYMDEVEEEVITDDSKQEMLYCCFYCNASRKSLESVKEHWKMVHKNIVKDPGEAASSRSTVPFRYKEIHMNPTKKMLRCGYCPKRGSAATIRIHSRKKHASKPVKFVEIPVIPEAPKIPEGWICQWCKEFCGTEAKMKVHQKMFHSHLRPTFKRQESNTPIEPEGHGCPECAFKTSSLAIMQKHVAKHVDVVRCKRCEKTFPDVTIAILHNRQAHPGEVSKIEGFTANVEKMMARVKWSTSDNSTKTSCETVARSSAAANTLKSSSGVAKKSTTKSLLRVQPRPTDYKAVARKSTNPLPRYPPGLTFSTDDIDATDTSTKEHAISYYGLPEVPVNLATISTYITLGGGRRMKVNCTTLAQLIDIKPQVVVKDLKQDLNNFVLFSNNKS